MIPASRRQPGFVAALIHRLAGLALAIFLPLHFVTLGSALSGADALDRFLAITQAPLIKLAECGIVIALAAHLTLGLRVLAIEFLDLRERTAVTLSACTAVVAGVGLLFLLNAG